MTIVKTWTERIVAKVERMTKGAAHSAQAEKAGAK